MLAVDDIITRLKAQTTEFRSVEGAMEMAALMRSKAPLVGKPIAHVVPTGVRGQKPDVATAAYSQFVDLGFSVIVTIPVQGDVTGGKRTTALKALVDAVTLALCGWGPEDAPGVCWLGAWNIARLDAEAIIVSIDFSITELLRI